MVSVDSISKAEAKFFQNVWVEIYFLWKYELNKIGWLTVSTLTFQAAQILGDHMQRWWKISRSVYVFFSAGFFAYSLWLS